MDTVKYILVLFLTIIIFVTMLVGFNAMADNYSLPTWLQYMLSAIGFVFSGIVAGVFYKYIGEYLSHLKRKKA